MDAAVTKNPAKSPIQIDIKIAPTVKLFAMLNAQSIITRNIANTTNPILIANEFSFSPMLYNWYNIIINIVIGFLYNVLVLSGSKKSLNSFACPRTPDTHLQICLIRRPYKHQELNSHGGDFGNDLQCLP